jgi:exodeoxyribonuclease VII small subunit
VAAKAGNRPTSGKVAGRAASDPSGNGAPSNAAAKAGEMDEQIPYEQARDQLTDVVKRLESGGLTLEESLELWERGERLAAICTQWLEGARARLTAARPEQVEPSDGAAPF